MPTITRQASISFCFVAAGALQSACGGDEPSSAPTCSVSTDDDGTIHIDCPDGGVEIPTCYEDLPDLDGSGTMDEFDCGLAGVAAAMRTVCAEPDAAWHISACRAVQTDLVFEGTLGRTELTTVNSRIAIAYSRAGIVHLWVDLDDDGHFDASEDHEIPGMTETPSLGVDADGCLAAVTTVAGFPNVPAIVWRDLNCDSTPDSDEVRSMALAEPDTRTGYPHITFPDGHLVVVFTQYPTSGGHTVRAWKDLDDDLTLGSGEMLTVGGANGSLVGVSSITDQNLVVYFHESLGPVRRWQSTEAWVFDSSDVIYVGALDSACGSIEFWPGSSGGGPHTCVTNGNGSGVLTVAIHDDIASPIEVGGAVIEVERGGTVSDAFVSVTERGRLVLWADRDRDMRVRNAEVVAADKAFTGLGIPGGEATVVNGWPVFFTDSNFGPEVQVVRWLPGSFLGEGCSLESDTCAGELVCRVSGNAPDARCVPPE